MPWQECSVASEREAFVLKVREEDVPIAELCRKFGISRKTGYKWLERYRTRGVSGLEDMSRRPHRSLHTTSGEVVPAGHRAAPGAPALGPQEARGSAGA